MASEVKLNRTFHPDDKKISYVGSHVRNIWDKYEAKSYGSEKDSLLGLYNETKKCYQWLKHHKVEIGLTSDASERSKMLLAIHENGSPVMNIPKRPFLKMALVHAEGDINKFLQLACEAATDGDFTGTKMGFEAAGQAGVNKIKEAIDARIPPPNAPITLHGGWMRNKKTGKPFYVKGKSGDIPLVDTGAFRDSFGYKVVYRK